MARASRALAGIALASMLCGFTAGPSQAALPAGVSLAPPGMPATSRQAELAASGYLERELFMQGQARTYVKNGDWPEDGRWGVKANAATQPFSTRLLVRRPADPARFNGVVIVEWLNTALDFDLDGGWMLMRDEILREGYAWVGVTAEAKGVSWLKAHDAKRYAQASIASNDLAFDIFTQAARTVRQARTDLLGSATIGTQQRPLKVLAMGYSQSGTFLSTYMNALQLQDKAFDGFYLRGTAPVAAPVVSSDWMSFSPRIRPDLNVPVMQVQTEMEVMVSWPLSKTPDTDKVRYWEIPGAAHLDRHLQAQSVAVAPASFTAVTPDCIKPTNDLPAYEVDNAALHALRQWMVAGTAPPKAPRMQRNSLGFVKSDELGNALGGLRLPEITVPVAHYGMYANFTRHPLSFGARYACVAGGSSTPLDTGDLKARYASKEDYLRRYKAAADALLQAGFMRPADHAQALKRAQTLSF